jgi:hypothetical protein
LFFHRRGNGAGNLIDFVNDGTDGIDGFDSLSGLAEKLEARAQKTKIGSPHPARPAGIRDQRCPQLAVLGDIVENLWQKFSNVEDAAGARLLVCFPSVPLSCMLAGRAKARHLHSRQFACLSSYSAFEGTP